MATPYQAYYNQQRLSRCSDDEIEYCKHGLGLQYEKYAYMGP